MIDYGYNQAEICWGDSYIDEVNIRKVLQGIKDIGGSRVRLAVQAGTLADLDRAVNLSVQYGLKPLLCIIDNPSLGYDGSVAGYGRMCTAIAKRYGVQGTNQVTEYELFNEPNFSGDSPRVTDPASFTNWLKAGYTAIKAVHSSSTVICGGVTPAADSAFFGITVNPITWYAGIYAAGGGKFFDHAGFHLYASEPPTPSILPWTFMTALRALMVAQGDSAKQVWVTEVGVGYPGGPGITDLAMARDWLKIMVQGIESYSWTGPFYIYNYRDCTTNTNDFNSIYGMVYNSYNPKQPVYDYAKTIRGTGTADTTPPSTPTGLTVTDVTDQSAALTWNTSTDNVGVIDYWVYLNGVKSAVSATTSVKLTALTPGSPYAVSVTAVDAAGNESSAVTGAFTTNVPSAGAVQAFFQYNFAGTGSTLPTTFVQLGLGFSVASDVALPNASGSAGTFWTVAPYTLDQQSPDHSSEIMQATASAYPDRAALALARVSPDGTQWVGALISGGGKADACKILTASGGTITLRKACNAIPLQPGERLHLAVKGNVYTASRITPDGVSTDVLSWTDINNAYPGKANLRTGVGWWHKRVGSVNYPAPGVTGTWKASDLSAVAPSSSGGFGGGFDLWMLAVTDEDDLGLVYSAGLWEAAL